LRRHLVREGGGWQIRFASAETKTGEPIDAPFPTGLVPYLERYLDHYRTLLMGERYRGERVWIGYRFKPEASHTIGITIAERTKRAFGRRVNPHLFRDCAATSIAVHDPITCGSPPPCWAIAISRPPSGTTTLLPRLRQRETTKRNSSGSGPPSQAA
jgi:integrase/recombinase XerD